MKTPAAWTGARWASFGYLRAIFELDGDVAIFMDGHALRQQVECCRVEFSNRRCLPLQGGQEMLDCTPACTPVLDLGLEDVALGFDAICAVAEHLVALFVLVLILYDRCVFADAVGRSSG